MTNMIGDEYPAGTRVIEHQTGRGGVITHVRTYQDSIGAEGDFPEVRWDNEFDSELTDWHSLIREENA
jgi:hypothetical protein